MSKMCKKCKQFKSLGRFYPAARTKDRRRGVCKACEIAVRGLRQKEQKVLDPDRRYGVVLKNKYGINFQLYKLMLEEQGNACAICKNTSPCGNNRYFCVDHCHKSGQIRGLLCYNCNVAIGFFKENQLVISAAIDYLNGDI